MSRQHPCSLSREWGLTTGSITRTLAVDNTVLGDYQCRALVGGTGGLTFGGSPKAGFARYI